MSSMRFCAVIDLNNIKHNTEVLYDNVPQKKPIIAVIKANGYGHGGVQICKMLDDNEKIYGFATATSEEALELRANGIKKPILILGYTFKEDYEELIKNNITFTVFDYETAKNISEVAINLNKKAIVHIKVDTGMSRIGFAPIDDSINIIKSVKELSGLFVQGIFTHFARADELNTDNVNHALGVFEDFVDRLHAQNIDFDIIHCANSASIMQIPKAHKSIVRAGIVIYGLMPSDEMATLNYLNIKQKCMAFYLNHLKIPLCAYKILKQ